MNNLHRNTQNGLGTLQRMFLCEVGKPVFARCKKSVEFFPFTVGEEGHKPLILNGRRCWYRTSGLFRVKEALYH
jgi:hypothetical protein